MANFNDSADPELGAACNRLAAFCEALPADMVIDRASGLTEPDLVMVLLRLHATRLIGDAGDAAPPPEARPSGRAGVPLTAKR